jgi:hypothetical protein
MGDRVGTENHKRHTWFEPGPGRTIALLLAAVLVGALIGQPTLSFAASTLNAYVKNWPKMPWRVAVVSEPTRTPVNPHVAFHILASSPTTSGTLYTVPPNKWLTLTQISLSGTTINGDGHFTSAELRQGASGLQLPIPVNNVVSWTGLSWLVCSSTFQTEWHVPPGTPIRYRLYRDTPKDFPANGEVGFSGYLTSAP